MLAFALALAALAQPAVDIHPGELQIPARQKVELKFTPPQIPAGHEAIISLQARNVHKRLAGGCPSLRLRLNGTLLGPERLVNRGRYFQLADGRIITIYGGAGFFLYYSPDYQAANKPGVSYQCMDGKAYDFELLVTDLLKPGENVLVIENGQPRSAVIVAARRIRLVLRPKSQIRPPTTGGVIPGKPRQWIQPRREKPKFSATILRGGAIGVSFAGRRWIIQSRYGCDGIGWIELAADRPDAPQAAKLRISRPSRTRPGWSITVETANWTLRRRIIPEAEVIRVVDTVRSKLNRDQALPSEHFITADVASADQVIIGGLPLPLKTGGRWTQQNPTTLVAFNSSGLGLMPIDDVTRVHSFNFAENSRAGFRDIYHALPAGATRRLEWWIVPAPDGDYWAMINALRRALGTNFRLDGSFVFVTPDFRFTEMTDERFAQFLDTFCLTYATVTISGPKINGAYPHGSAMYAVDTSEWKRTVARIHRLRPKLKVLFYYHTFIDAHPQAREKFADCRCLKPDRTQYDYNDPRYPIFLPTLDNAFGRQVERNARFLINQIGADGLYWDEMERSRTDYCWGGWDECSADIDMKKVAILRKKTSVTLASLPLRRKILDWLLSENRPIVANGQPTTMTMTREYKFPRFVETGSISNLTYAHLYSPIGLGDHHTERTQQDTIDAQRRHLMWGCLYYYYHPQATLNVKNPGLSRYMWPCTPIEIGPGYIIARERILTAVSGYFSWGDRARAKVHILDRTGREVDPAGHVREITRRGATWWQITLPPGGTAAIIRTAQ